MSLSVKSLPGAPDRICLKAIPREFGRHVLRPWAQIVGAGLLVLMVTLTICYPFPLRLADIPKKSSKAFTAVVIVGHENGRVRGYEVTDTSRDFFNIRESQAEGAVLKQLRKYDLANSRLFAVGYWLLLILTVAVRWFGGLMSRLFPDRIEVVRYDEMDSMAEFKRYMANRLEAMRPSPRTVEQVNMPRGDRWYRRPYWNEIAMTCTLVVTLGFGLGFWRYLNPDIEKGSVNMKAAAKGVGNLKVKSYPDGSQRGGPSDWAPPR